MSPAQSLIMKHGVFFYLERDGLEIAGLRGLPNHENSTGKAYIGVFPDVSVIPGDWLISPSNERLYVKDTMTNYYRGKPNQLKIYYQTLAEHNTTPVATNIFNIGTANGSVIGTQANVTLTYNESIQNAKEQIAATDSPDKQELQQLISLLEMVVNNQVTPHKGLFSKFSAIMERNSWITGTITSALLNWLMTQIP